MHTLVAYIGMLVQQLPRHTMRPYQGHNRRYEMDTLVSLLSVNRVHPTKYSIYALAQHIIRMDESASATSENLNRAISILLSVPRYVARTRQH